MRSSDDDLDQPEHENEDPPGHLGAAGARPCHATAFRPHRFLAAGGIDSELRPPWVPG